MKNPAKAFLAESGGDITYTPMGSNKVLTAVRLPFAHTLMSFVPKGERDGKLQGIGD